MNPPPNIKCYGPLNEVMPLLAIFCNFCGFCLQNGAYSQVYTPIQTLQPLQAQSKKNVGHFYQARNQMFGAYGFAVSVCPSYVRSSSISCMDQNICQFMLIIRKTAVFLDILAKLGHFRWPKLPKGISTPRNLSIEPITKSL